MHRVCTRYSSTSTCMNEKRCGGSCRRDVHNYCFSNELGDGGERDCRKINNHGGWMCSMCDKLYCTGCAPSLRSNYIREERAKEEREAAAEALRINAEDINILSNWFKQIGISAARLDHA